jgi:ribosomal protein S6
VNKFRNLWKAGHTASLKIEAHAGEAWVELHVGLGVPNPVQGDYQHHGNARQRRREKRAAARAAESAIKAAETAAIDGQVEEVHNRNDEKIDEEAKKIDEALNDTVKVNISSRVIDEFENENSISEEVLTYSFKSDYAQEDIEDTLIEILPKNMTPILVSRVRIQPLDADHLCIVALKRVKKQNFSWPILELESENAKVIREVERIQQQ